MIKNGKSKYFKDKDEILRTVNSYHIMSKKDITLIYNLYKLQSLSAKAIARLKHVKFGKTRVYKLIKYIKQLEFYDIDQPYFLDFEDLLNS